MRTGIYIPRWLVRKIRLYSIEEQKEVKSFSLNMLRNDFLCLFRLTFAFMYQLCKEFMILWMWNYWELQNPCPGAIPIFLIFRGLNAINKYSRDWVKKNHPPKLSSTFLNFWVNHEFKIAYHVLVVKKNVFLNFWEVNQEFDITCQTYHALIVYN